MQYCPVVVLNQLLSNDVNVQNFCSLCPPPLSSFKPAMPHHQTSAVILHLVADYVTRLLFSTVPLQLDWNGHLNWNLISPSIT